MLAEARKDLARAGVEAPLYEIDYRDLPAHFDRRFDAVVCLGGSLLETSSDAEMLRALRSMREVLREDGVLVLSQGMTDELWRERPRFVLEVNTPDVSRLLVIDYFHHGAGFNVLDIFRSQAESGLKTWSMDQPHVLLRDDYYRLLDQAGFKDIRYFGGHRFDA